MIGALIDFPRRSDWADFPVGFIAPLQSIATDRDVTITIGVAVGLGVETTGTEPEPEPEPPPPQAARLVRASPKTPESKSFIYVTFFWNC